jgi:hypothetical protein
MLSKLQSQATALESARPRDSMLIILKYGEDSAFILLGVLPEKAGAPQGGLMVLIRMDHDGGRILQIYNISKILVILIIWAYQAL